ncbi:MAG: hypothetical protein WKF91_23580 [Segetibacter sp.]
MREYQIWSEGFAATGERGGATFHGKQMAETFDEACDLFFKGNSTYDSLLDGRDMKTLIRAYWGCRLFDNEADARRSFG